MTKLYIVHGWAYSVEPWEETINHLKNHDISPVMMKVPGLTTQTDKFWTISEYAEWLKRELESEDDVVILGHSNGGRIIMNLAINQPDRFKHIILLNSAGVYDKRLRRIFLKILAKILAPAKYVPGVKRVASKLVGSDDYYKANENMKVTLANVIKSDKYLHPENLKVPTSILWGQEDNTTPVKHAKKLHSLIAGSTLKVIPKWSHAPYRTHPEQLADEIAEIVGRI